MKNYRTQVIDKVQIYLDQNVEDYTEFKAATGYKKISKNYHGGGEQELGGTGSYLMKVEEESHIKSELG